MAISITPISITPIGQLPNRAQPNVYYVVHSSGAVGKRDHEVTPSPSAKARWQADRELVSKRPDENRSIQRQDANVALGTSGMAVGRHHVRQLCRSGATLA